MESNLLATLLPVPKAGEVVLDSQATGAKVLKVREKLGISQKALAMQMGVSASYLCDLEHGRRDWSMVWFNQAKAAMEELIR